MMVYSIKNNLKIKGKENKAEKNPYKPFTGYLYYYDIIIKCPYDQPYFIS